VSLQEPPLGEEELLAQLRLDVAGPVWRVVEACLEFAAGLVVTPLIAAWLLGL
jgi:hypothetical protein